MWINDQCFRLQPGELRSPLRLRKRLPKFSYALNWQIPAILIKYPPDSFVESPHSPKRSLRFDGCLKVPQEELLQRFLPDGVHLFRRNPGVCYTDRADASRKPTFQCRTRFPQKTTIFTPFGDPAARQLR